MLGRWIILVKIRAVQIQARLVLRHKKGRNLRPF
jgi:hypothetical protein